MTHPGSPPRAWGKVPESLLEAIERGFTPTGVGKSHPRVPLAARARVHPHGRGEKVPDPSWLTEQTGSPPRAWGKVPPSPPPPFPPGSPPRAWGKGHASGRQATYRGFTPTGVGKSFPGWVRLLSCSVHPHGRGEKHCYSPVPLCVSGSPPRAWGKDIRGINPERDEGSPPRAWGKGRVSCGSPGTTRFTPTGVGKSRWRS